MMFLCILQYIHFCVVIYSVDVNVYNIYFI